jgi:signal recognition particle receptor subunit beta
MTQIIQTLIKLAAVLVQKYGIEVLVYTIDSIQSHYRRLFRAKNILILGPKSSGKTSLIYLLRYGAPFIKKKDGTIETPDPTAMGIIVGHKFSPRTGHWASVSKDLPGDEGLRFEWTEAIKELKPHGIIYIVDGTSSNDSAMVEDIKQLFESAYSTGIQPLAAFHVFINFSDMWAKSESSKRSRLRKFEEKLDSVFSENPSWSHLRVGTHATTLSSNVSSWPEANRAVEKFGTDLHS